MKFLLLFLLLAIDCYSCIAQNDAYRPFVEEGKIWYMKYQNREAPEFPDYDFSYYIQGDTVIGGIECKKLYAYNENNAHETKYLLAIFENDRKVYFIPNNMESSYVLYDFAITNGDIGTITDAMHTDWEKNMKNIEEKTVNINGESRRCIHVQTIWGNPALITDISSGWWIEGVGSELGPLNTWLYGAMGNCSYFQKCVINEKEIFNTEEFKGLITNIQHVKQIGRNDIVNTFSISGVKANHGNGIVIQDKKKVIKLTKKGI